MKSFEEWIPEYCVEEIDDEIRRLESLKMMVGTLDIEECNDSGSSQIYSGLDYPISGFKIESKLSLHEARLDLLSRGLRKSYDFSEMMERYEQCTLLEGEYDLEKRKSIYEKYLLINYYDYPFEDLNLEFELYENESTN